MFFRSSGNGKPSADNASATSTASSSTDAQGNQYGNQIGNNSNSISSNQSNSQRELMRLKRRLLDGLFNTLDLSLLESVSEAQAREQINKATIELLQNHELPMTADTRKRLLKEVCDEILGLGPLEPLLADKGVSDILVNGFDKIYVERGGKLELTGFRFQDDAHLLNIIDRIVSMVGRRIDESSPMVDARLKDGSRVNAIIPPLAIDGPSLSIRRFAVERLGMDSLIAFGTLDEAMARFFNAIVQGRLNILISGGTGSGKTTTLNIFSSFIPASDRIITIEDSAELQLQQPHVVRLETRPPNIEGRGSVTQRELVINALRMRPDRIVVGEVRGAEAVDMLTAMNTGHDGSMTTIHANTPRDALSRIENMFAMAGWNMPTKNLRAQIASALNIVVQLKRMEDGKRRIVSVQEINGMEGDVITMTELFKFERQSVDKEGNIVGRYMPTGNIPTFMDAFRHMGIDLPYSLFSPQIEQRR